VHTICLIFGGLGLISLLFVTDKYMAFIPMIGIGIAWASILSMPYVILAGAVKPERMGVYMGVFNLFIVIPQIVQNFLTPRIFKPVFGDDPMYAVVFGGILMLIAAATVSIVNDVGERKIETVTGGGH
jgi:maltose/moltooligosaccharide transporter